jgi:hypothetical protein
MAKRNEHDPDEAEPESRYGDELLRANWNPVIELLQWSCDTTAALARSAPAAEVSDEEAAAFLGRFYSSGA